MFICWLFVCLNYLNWNRKYLWEVVWPTQVAGFKLKKDSWNISDFLCKLHWFARSSGCWEQKTELTEPLMISSRFDGTFEMLLSLHELPRYRVGFWPWIFNFTAKKVLQKYGFFIWFCPSCNSSTIILKLICRIFCEYYDNNAAHYKSNDPLNHQ